MKYRYLSIFLFVLVLSIGAVCAQDNVTDVDLISQSSNDVISVDSNIDIKQANESSTQEEIHINDANYADYFDEDGKMNSNISDGSILYIGDVTNKTFIVDKVVTISPDNTSNIIDSKFSFVDGSDMSLINGLTFNNADIGAITVNNASGILISNNIININAAGNVTEFAILAQVAKNLIVSSNEIYFTGKTDGYAPANAVRVTESDNAVIDDNILEINIPSCPVGWTEIPAGSGNWVSSPISEGVVISNSNNISFRKNTVKLNATDVIGDYDTIYVVDINDCSDAIVADSEITANGHSYIYGLIISGDKFNVTNNTISTISDTYYADGIDVEGPATGIVESNVVTVSAPTSAYGIYAAMSNGNVSVDYKDNIINADAYAAFGMEMSGIISDVLNNVITVQGNYTTGIATRITDVNIAENNITAKGSGKGNESIWDGFGVQNVGIKTIDNNAIIVNNTINSNDNGISASRANLTVLSNTLDVVDTGSDDSYGIYVVESSNVEIDENDITYEGHTNGTFVNNAMYIGDSAIYEVSGNNFNITIPSAPVNWVEIPAGSWNYVRIASSEGIVFNNDTGLKFNDNKIDLTASEAVGDYDTIYVIDSNCDNAVISGNDVLANGKSYIYGLIISGENLNVSNNDITSISDSYYADGIDVEGPATGIVESNVVTVSAPTSAYGIYAAMSNGNVSVDYKDNIINADAYAAFGMEMSGIISDVLNNVITVQGNYTTGIATRITDVNIAENNITAKGSGKGNESIWDGFGVQNVGIKTIDNNAIIVNNTINSNDNGISASRANLTVLSNTLDVVDTGSDDSYGIYVVESSNVEIDENDITYEGHTNGTFVNNAMYIGDSAIYEVSGNNFNITIPSAPVNWVEIPAGSWNYVRIASSEGIVFNNDTGLKFNDNKIDLTASEAVGDYDTIYVIDSNCDNAVISGNDVLANGKSYIYGLIISGENLNVSNNDITSISDTYYANAIDVEGPASGSFDNNNFTAISPVVAYGVYSSMSGSDVNATYTNNNILCVADIVYGMELAGTNETATENTIEVYGNKTMGIAGKSSTLNIANNEINALGKNLGNTTIWESFEPETVGVKIIGGNATVYGNNIKSNGTSAVNVTTTNASVTYNYLVSNESFGDASVYFDGNATVHDNLPDYDAFLETDDVVMYYKNGTRFTANLVNFYGEPLENMTITFTINGVDYNKTTNEKGTASMAINLPSGEYEVITTFDPGYNKTPTVNSNSLTVLTTVFGDDLVKVYRNESQYYATFVDGQGNPLDSGTEVKFNINGVWYNRKISENGTAKLNINLPQGEYIITAVNPENGEMHTNNITVLSSITDNEDLVKYYKNDSQYVVTVLGSDGNPVGAGEIVKFNINGVMYERETNASGQAKLNINLQPGNYTITAEYNGCKVSNNIEVLPVLRANDLIKKYGVSDQFIAYLVDGQGKPFEGQNVTFNINGVFYNRLTDSDGRAILNIKLGAAMDTYIITSSYNGSSISNKISVIP